MEKRKRAGMTVFQMTLGALYVALFALAGNVPLLSAIQIIPGVPITLQVFLVAMMGLTLGVRGGLMSYAAVLILTACGLPMMAGGKGGLPVFIGPTCGYIYGWVFIVILTGLYSSYAMDRLIHRPLVRAGSASASDKPAGALRRALDRLLRMSIHLPASFAVGMAGVLLDYLCGSAALAAIGGKGLHEVPVLLLSNLAFLPGDMIKIGLASALSLSLFAGPALSRFFASRRVCP